jgi:hypothetical protein
MSLVAAMGIGFWVGSSYSRSDAGSEAGDVAIGTIESQPALEHASAAVEDVRLPDVAADDPALLARVQPLLNKGADLQVVSSGFRNAEQLAVVAHAARNTGAPFMVLKHNVLESGMSVPEAIEAATPELNGTIEADLALAEARRDIAGVTSATE